MFLYTGMLSCIKWVMHKLYGMIVIIGALWNYFFPLNLKFFNDDIMDDETLKVFAYVNISSYRVRCVKALKGEIKTPTVIAKDSNIKLNHISKILHQLKDCGVAVCLNEDARRGRMYRLTSLGDEIVDHLDNVG